MKAIGETAAELMLKRLNEDMGSFPARYRLKTEMLIPLDTYSEKPVALMAVVPGDPVVPAIWEEYERIIYKSEMRDVQIELVERFDFYERAKEVLPL